eukprot:7829968-Alexandrium_andersonii.AAC.1
MCIRDRLWGTPPGSVNSALRVPLSGVGWCPAPSRHALRRGWHHPTIEFRASNVPYRAAAGAGEFNRSLLLPTRESTFRCT